MAGRLFGGELLDEKARDEIVRLLLGAFADEWIAGYYYMLTAQLVQGPGSQVVAEMFMEEAREELTKHAPMIGERLSQLGVEPPREFARLWELSPCKYPELPSDPFDVEGFIIAAVKAELCAIEGYKRLYEAAHGRDPVTEKLAKELLEDEVSHRNMLVGMLSKEGLRRLEETI